MQASDLLQLAATLLEIIIAAFATLVAVRGKKTYAWFIAVTFSLFVLFDIIRIFALPVSEDIHSGLFLLACILMLYGVWTMYLDLLPAKS